MTERAAHLVDAARPESPPASARRLPKPMGEHALRARTPRVPSLRTNEMRPQRWLGVRLFRARRTAGSLLGEPL